MPAPATLVEQNLRLVGYVVNRTRTVLEREDAEAEARLGLLKAAQGFDPARGMAFSTYAVPTLVRHVQRGSRKVQEAREHEFSGDVPLTEAGDGETLLELQPDPHAIDPEEAALRALERQELEAALAGLKPEYARLLRLRYGFDGPPLEAGEAARLAGFSRGGGWMAEKRALAQLRAILSGTAPPARPRPERAPRAAPRRPHRRRTVPPTFDRHVFADRLQTARKAARLSQEQAAAAAGLSTETWRSYEKAKRLPTLDAFAMLLAVLPGASPGWLMGLE